MTIEREVEIDVGKMGLWTMIAPDCPANVMKEKLGERPLACRAGASTQIQGAIPLTKCQWLSGEIEERGDKPVAQCSFDDAGTPNV